MNGKDSKIRWLEKLTSDTVTCATAPGFFELFEGLTDKIETDLISEGRAVKISRWRYFLRLVFTTDNEPGIVQPVIVQTAGNLADTVNLSSHSVVDIVDAACDDEFGIQMIAEPKVATLKNVSIDSGIKRYYILEMQFDVPQNIIQLLNKEQQSELTQKLYIGLAGLFSANVATLTLEGFEFIDYIIMQKGITIR